MATTDVKRNVRMLMGLIFALSSTQPGFSQTAPSLVTKSWALVGTYGIDARKAWSQLRGSCASVTVAVIDTGVDFSHPDLKNSAWINTKELNGKPNHDDDGNGFNDDIYGYDFVEKTGKVSVDEHGHGSHIAGIIAADSKDGSGIKGVCPGAKIMSLRYHGPKVTGPQALEYTVNAIHYAIKNGAKIINYSGGGRYYSGEEFAAMKAAEAAGVLVVAAAGNETSNVDQEENRYYPASYGLTNIISVGGIDSTGSKVRSSNWGSHSVDIAAPGKEILSTTSTRKGLYEMLTGTSQATAFVSGVAALIYAQNSNLKFNDVRDIIVNSGKKTKTLAGMVKQSSRLSAASALESAKKRQVIARKSAKPAKRVAKKKPDLERSTATWQNHRNQTPQSQIHPALNQ
ncbi:MAG TPA: S8 family serine peptidase [Bdellovibrionota bacterium]|jgi:subtilisin family serine protease|nr:S8 family serine peptidase [Bdellovibrionota bacterium]